MERAYKDGYDNGKYLADVTLRLRKMISELQSKNSDLERRVWELEDHTPKEYLEMAQSALDDWTGVMKVSTSKPMPPELLKSLRKKYSVDQNESTVSGTSKLGVDE